MKIEEFEHIQSEKTGKNIVTSVRKRRKKEVVHYIPLNINIFA